MNITKQSLELVDSLLEDSNLTMCEFGIQTIFLPEGKVNPKDYFSKKGVEHTSITICEDSDIVTDLDVEINKKLRNKFDVITNFGYCNHLKSFYNGIRNAHLLCKKDGVIVQEIPTAAGAGWYIASEFISTLADEAQYKILDLKTTSKTIIVAFQKKSYQFLSEERFNELGIFC